MMDLSWLVTSVLGLSVLYLIYWFFTMNNSYWKKRGVPSKKALPLVGDMWEVVLRKKGFGEVMTDVYKRFDTEKVCGYFQFFTPVIMIRDPELINQVLIKDFTYFEDRGPPMKGVDDLFNLSLSNLTGEEWRNARHKLTPTFTSGKLKMMFGPIKECSDEVVRHIDNKPDEIFEVRDLMLRYILNVIGNVAFGLKFDILTEKDEQSTEFFKKTSSFFKPSILLFFKFMIAISKPKLREILKLRLLDEDIDAYFRGLTRDIIKHRRQTNTRRNDFLQIMLDLQKKELSKELSSDSCGREEEPIENEDKELLDQLKNTPAGNHELSNKEIYTEDFISSQTFMFISGGSETTSTVLSFVFYELAANQDCQKKVQNEINNVLNSQEFSYQNLKKLIYMEQFINETLRIHPLAAGLFRICTRDYKIPGTEITIEKGTTVNVPAGGLHKDPQYFSDPDKFNPDRFEDMESLPRGVFFSFGAGPRICIAMRLAMLEMKILLATVLSKYTVVLSEKTKLPLKLIKSSFIPRVDGGVWIKFIKRES